MIQCLLALFCPVWTFCRYSTAPYYRTYVCDCQQGRKIDRQKTWRLEIDICGIIIRCLQNCGSCFAAEQFVGIIITDKG